MVLRVYDEWDDPWDVYDVRPTGQPWPVYLGRPAYREQGPDRRGGNRVILTSELVRYFEENRTRRGGLHLPIGRTAIKRLRKVLGLNLARDVRQWWEEHADELASMTEVAFAEKYGYSPARVSQMNQVLFGKRLREPGWWKMEPARSLLSGEAPRLEVAEQLSISVGAVGRLRWVLRHNQ